MANEINPSAADLVMNTQVAVPAFFAKLAACGAPAPVTEADAGLWCRTGDLVTYVVKVAYDTLFSGRTTFKDASAALGITDARLAVPSTDASLYLKNADVRAAAEALVQGA